MENGTVTLTMRVSEALPRDVGRGIARLDPKDMRELGAEVGDVIEITGKRVTVAKLMPAYPDARGKSLIQIDGITRENAGVGLDEKVEVKRTDARPAERIVMKPLTLMPARSHERDVRYIGKLIEGMPLIKGDRVRATLFGSRAQDFRVVETVPQNRPVIVHTATLLSIQREDEGRREGSKISYEDIGGLHREIQRVREMIELPLKYPQVFERLGIDAPKGVLLLGPPGTGKTLIARAVANETDASFLTVNGPEIVHRFYGESEAKLRGIFEQASKQAPAIIFLDEIDAISPKRETVVGEVEKRIVSQLLTLMDGLKDRGNVIVIGATNMPNLIDPALRRPGRFDREITIGIPDKAGREEILQIHTRGMPLAGDVDLKRLAEITHGFVGADLAALCREAAMSCLRTIFPKIDFGLDQIPYETLLDLEVTMGHFMEALKEVEPSVVREVTIETPDVRWDDIGDLEEVKQRLIEAVEWPLMYAELFERAKTTPPRGILLHGPPGTGKTLLAKAVARESEANFISIKGPALMSKWVGEAERGVRDLFKKARQAAPCILFFDELDALAPTRGARTGDSGVTERVISQLLTEIDGLEELKGVIILAATNRVDLIDPALLRPGRFDLPIELPIPNIEGRRKIFEVHLRGKPIASDVAIDLLVEVTEGCVGAEIEGICRAASILAIRDYLDMTRGEAGDPSKLVITMDHFRRAVEDTLHRSALKTC
ncbi:MAG: CDC48 family AAA ATPase [Candidatus Latescibacteria bacterium]|nr:CDC48 family AAA ATPase [Candidatus Latescibacterota bacterium]